MKRIQHHAKVACIISCRISLLAEKTICVLVLLFVCLFVCLFVFFSSIICDSVQYLYYKTFAYTYICVCAPTHTYIHTHTSTHRHTPRCKCKCVWCLLNSVAASFQPATFMINSRITISKTSYVSSWVPK